MAAAIMTYSSSVSSKTSGHGIKVRLTNRNTLMPLLALVMILHVTVLVRYTNHRLSLTDTPWKTEAMSPVWDTTMLPAPPQPPSTEQKKKLVVFNALGRREAIQYSWFHKRNHFADWDCIAFLYVDDRVVPENDFYLMQLQQPTENDSTACTVIRTPNVAWGVFLQYLAPPFVQQYEYIALMLDDVFLPVSGPHPIRIPKLLESIEKYNLSSISPSIQGGTWSVMNGELDLHAHYQGRSTRHCLVRPSMIETYSQIFTKQSWQCYYPFFHAKAGCGWGLDYCFAQYCAEQSASLAVDYNMVGYHLEFFSKGNNSWFNETHRALVTSGTNLTFPKIKRLRHLPFYKSQQKLPDTILYVARRYNCAQTNDSLVGIWECPHDHEQ